MIFIDFHTEDELTEDVLTENILTKDVLTDLHDGMMLIFMYFHIFSYIFNDWLLTDRQMDIAVLLKIISMLVFILSDVILTNLDSKRRDMK